MASTPEENAALVRAFLTDVVAGGDTDALATFLADEAVHSRAALESPTRLDAGHPEAWLVLAAADVDVAIERVVAADDRVAVRGRVTGTHCESLLDLAPTGRSFEIAVAWFCRVENGRISDLWSLSDRLGLLRQLRTDPVEQHDDDSLRQVSD